ncbi:MAG TPA: hypothetical protein VFR67_30265 [Pilimelia sp.]|nr:hypothetical protein [Pilimelia sp.]
MAYLRYRSTGQAIRAGRLPTPGTAPLMTAGVVILAAVLVTIYLLR